MLTVLKIVGVLLLLVIGAALRGYIWREWRRRRR